MKLVAAHPVSEARSLPDAALLERMRTLGARYPEARLRPVTLVRAAELDERADRTGRTRVWLALECLQVTGSFKARGALAALAALREKSRGPIHIVAASAGNHGAGVAYAARVLGVSATVVVPKSAPRAKRDRIAACGAEVRLAASIHYDDAEAEALALAAREGLPFVSAYDDLDVLAGNGGSLGFEIARALGRVPDAVVVPFGGGGLASGMACALATDEGETPGSAAMPRRVWGVQSDACPAMAQSLETGVAIEKMGAEETLADGLEGGISARAFARAASVVAGVGVVTEAAISDALAFAAREVGLVLEGSAACALAPALLGLPPQVAGGDVVFVLTGRNVDRAVLDKALDV